MHSISSYADKGHNLRNYFNVNACSTIRATDESYQNQQGHWTRPLKLVKVSNLSVPVELSFWAKSVALSASGSWIREQNTTLQALPRFAVSRMLSISRRKAFWDIVSKCPVSLLESYADSVLSSKLPWSSYIIMMILKVSEYLKWPQHHIFFNS